MEAIQYLFIKTFMMMMMMMIMIVMMMACVCGCGKGGGVVMCLYPAGQLPDI